MEIAHQWIAVITTITVFVLLNARRTIPIDLLFLCAMLVVTVTGIISPIQAIQGFAHPAVITIGALLAIAAALKKCGVLDWVGRTLLGNVKNERVALWRLAITLVTSSAFLLNTALVAMMAPVVGKWCHSHNIAPSRLLMPVSYLAILGGICTLIGTSTTLVIQAELQSSNTQLQRETHLLQDQFAQETDPDQRDAFADQIKTNQHRLQDLQPLHFFELGKAGVPIALCGAIVLLIVAPRLLPNREGVVGEVDDNRREYLVEMQVDPGCVLIGKTIRGGGLRNLAGVFLIEIGRDEHVISPVSPDIEIEERDRLVFSGLVDTIVDLKNIRGLVSATTDIALSQKLDKERHLVEVVLSPRSPLIRSTVRSINFRRRYNAAVLAVHRNGERVTNKIGEIRLRAGDTLLLQADADFVDRHRDNNEFYLVSSYGETVNDAYRKMPLAAFIFVALLAWLAISSLLQLPENSAFSSPAIAGLVAVAILVMTSCMRMVDAHAAIDIPILVTIACALGLGLALEESGAARTIAESLVSLVGNENKLFLLITVYLLTMLLTEMISNNAVAALMFPIAVNLAHTAECNARPFVIAICFAASLAFVTPIGYQTNLMVMGPGGYRPSDYLRNGMPISITSATIAIILIPIFWPF